MRILFVIFIVFIGLNYECHEIHSIPVNSELNKHFRINTNPEEIKNDINMNPDKAEIKESKFYNDISNRYLNFLSGYNLNEFSNYIENENNRDDNTLIDSHLLYATFENEDKNQDLKTKENLSIKEKVDELDEPNYILVKEEIRKDNMIFNKSNYTENPNSITDAFFDNISNTNKNIINLHRVNTNINKKNNMSKRSVEIQSTFNKFYVIRNMIDSYKIANTTSKIKNSNDAVNDKSFINYNKLVKNKNHGYNNDYSQETSEDFQNSRKITKYVIQKTGSGNYVKQNHKITLQNPDILNIYGLRNFIDKTNSLFNILSNINRMKKKNSIINTNKTKI